jgi:hypothetical protein
VKSLRDFALIQRGHVCLARPASDLDPTGLQSLRHFALQLDAQNAILKLCPDHLHMFGKVEALPERPGRFHGAGPQHFALARRACAPQ